MTRVLHWLVRILVTSFAFGGAADDAAAGEPRYVRALSRAARVIFEAPGGGAWFLLEPGGQLILTPRAERHRLVHGTLLVARSSAVAGNEPISLQLGSYWVQLRPGAALVQKHGENDFSVHLLQGEALVGGGGWSQALPEGQSFHVAAGARPAFRAIDPAMMEGKSEVFRALAIDPLPGAREGPLSNAVVGVRTTGEGNTWYRFASLDPAIKDVRSIRHFGTSQPLEAGGIVSGTPPVRVPRDSGRFGFLQVKDGGVTGGLGISVEKLDITNGFLLRNVLEAEGPKHARAHLEDGIFIVTPQGGSVVIERVHDAYGAPTSRTRLILPHGYGFLDFRHMDRRSAGELTLELQVGDRGWTVVSDRKGDLRMRGLLLIQDDSRVADAGALTNRAQRELDQLQAHAAGLTRGSDPCLTVLVSLPRSAEALRASLPIIGAADPTAALQVGSTVKLGQKGEGPAGSNLWVTEARSEDEIAPLAAFEALQQALGGPQEASLDPELTAEILKPLIVPGEMPEDLGALAELLAQGGTGAGKLPPGVVLPFEEVGRRAIDIGRALSTLFLVGFLACLALAISRTDVGRILLIGKVRCPHCQGVTASRSLLRGDPTSDFDCAEAMARLARDGTEEGEEFFVRTMKQLLDGRPKSRTNPYFVLWAYWCARCSRGFLMTQVVCGFHILDQDIVEFGSEKTWGQLRKGS